MGNHAEQALTAHKTTLVGSLRSRFIPVLGYLLAGLFCLGPASAQEEVADGEEAGYVSPHNAANDYLDAIDRMEAEYGPYATELSDLYLGLGQSLLDRGDYEQARDAFHRGVMVVRVNSGPNSPEQTNHLYLIANIETLLGNSIAADIVLKSIYLINSDFYGEEKPEMLPVLARMYQWYLVARPPGSVESMYKDYERAIELTKKMADISESAWGFGHPDTALAYRRLGEAQFQAALFMNREEEYFAITSAVLDPRGEKQVSGRDHYSDGRKAFNKYVESVQANTTSTPVERAESLLLSGDWYVVLGKARTAQRYYEDAYQVLAQSEDYAELAESYMRQPEPVYFFYPKLNDLQDAPTELREISLDVSMTVTNSGEVRNVEVLNAPEDMPEDYLAKIKREVRDIPFRPAMKEGEVVTTKDFIWHVTIVPDAGTS